LISWRSRIGPIVINIIMYSSCRLRQNVCVSGDDWVLPSTDEFPTVWQPAVQQHDQSSCMMIEKQASTSALHRRHHHQPWYHCELQRQTSINGGSESLHHHHHHQHHRQLNHQVDGSSLAAVDNISYGHHVNNFFHHGGLASPV